MRWRQGWIGLAFALAAVLVSGATQADWFEPAPGSPVRKAIMDAARPHYEMMLGAPLLFEVDHLEVAGRMAFLAAYPVRPNGSVIDPGRYAAGQDCIVNNRIGAPIEVILRWQGGRWRVTEAGLCEGVSLFGLYRDRAGLAGWID
jgi:hypothetical protein